MPEARSHWVCPMISSSTWSSRMRIGISARSISRSTWSRRDGPTAASVSATSPDIKQFVSRGAKLVIYHGWGDTNVPPRSSVNYHKRLVDTLGAPDVHRSVRLYMAPGMGHCGGGEGPNVFDALTALEQWREEGKAPAEILASQLADGRVVRTRPLCPYPQIARYKGSRQYRRRQQLRLRDSVKGGLSFQ